MGNDGINSACDVASQSLEVFDVIEDRVPLEQGDILFLCPYIYPIPERIDWKTKTLPAWVQKWNVLILGHSCDILQNKVDLVLLCPIWEINDYFRSCATRFVEDERYRSNFENDQKKFKDDITSLIADAAGGKRLGYVVLKEALLREKHTEPWLVDFTNAYALPLSFLNIFYQTDENNEFRLRLTPDYRTDLIARFSYFLLRAVLPKEDFSFKANIKPNIDYDKINSILTKTRASKRRKKGPFRSC